MTHKVLFYEVPAATVPRPCKGTTCKATIYLIDRPSGKQMPVDCDVPDGSHPTATEAGLGVNHYTTCVDAAQFHRRKK